MSTPLQVAIELAVRAHREMEDRTTADGALPYILHPMRVMLAMQHHKPGELEALRCVAILHDAVERGRLTMSALKRAGLPSRVVKAVRLLTHDKKQSYARYIEALARNDLARAVKMADLRDNAELGDLPLRSRKLKKDLARPARYAASYQFLAGQLDRRSYQTMMKLLENSD